MEALPDVLTALDRALQDEVRRTNGDHNSTQQILARLAGASGGDRSASVAHDQRKEGHNVSGSGPQGSHPGHGVAQLLFLRAEAIPEHQMKVHGDPKSNSQSCLVCMSLLYQKESFRIDVRSVPISSPTFWYQEPYV